jgi:hypothetical protein
MHEDRMRMAAVVLDARDQVLDGWCHVMSSMLAMRCMEVGESIVVCCVFGDGG